MVGGQASIPLTKGIALIGSVTDASGDLRIGLPLLGGVNAGRVQAKDWASRFHSEDALGFRAEGNLANNWAFTAGVKLTF